MEHVEDLKPDGTKKAPARPIRDARGRLSHRVGQGVATGRKQPNRLTGGLGMPAPSSSWCIERAQGANRSFALSLRVFYNYVHI